MSSVSGQAVVPLKVPPEFCVRRQYAAKPPHVRRSANGRSGRRPVGRFYQPTSRSVAENWQEDQKWKGPPNARANSFESKPSNDIVAETSTLWFQSHLELRPLSDLDLLLVGHSRLQPVGEKYLGVRGGVYKRQVTTCRVHFIAPTVSSGCPETVIASEDGKGCFPDHTKEHPVRYDLITPQRPKPH